MTARIKEPEMLTVRGLTVVDDEGREWITLLVAGDGTAAVTVKDETRRDHLILAAAEDIGGGSLSISKDDKAGVDLRADSFREPVERYRFMLTANEVCLLIEALDAMSGKSNALGPPEGYEALVARLYDECPGALEAFDEPYICTGMTPPADW